MNIHQLRRMTARIPRNIERKDNSETPDQKLTREIKEIKTQILDAIKNKADVETVTAMQRQLDALDIRLAERHVAGGANQKSLAELLKADESFQRLCRDRKGTAILNLKGADCALMERKTTITSGAVGSSTSGVLQIERIPGIVGEARQTLRLRSLLTARPTSLQIIDFVRVSTPMQVASPQTEASAKAENAVTFTTESEKVQTIATWQPASRQVLDDFDELAAFIRGSLAYYVELEEELQMLSGSGAGTDLNGLITQATPFDSSLLSGSWQRIDVIGAAIQQVEEAKEIEPTFAVLNPRDWWLIRRTKDANDNYILGAPGSEGSRRLWDLDVIATNNMDAGDFLVGSGNPAAAEIRDRMEMQIEVSTQHEDYFTRNLVAIRAEKRLALITKRPASFIEGTFTTSP